MRGNSSFCPKKNNGKIFVSLFLSTTVSKIDKKGRVSVPAHFRTSLTVPEIVLFPSPKHQCLEGFDVSFMNEMSSRIEHFDMFSDEQDDLAMSVFGQSISLNLDDTGRVLLPKALLSFAQLSEQVAFVGMGKKFQVWSAELLEDRQKTARINVQAQKMTIPRGGTNE